MLVLQIIILTELLIEMFFSEVKRQWRRDGRGEMIVRDGRGGNEGRDEKD